MEVTAVRRARLRPPRVPAGALARTRLLELGATGVEHGRLVVVAGAGYGKSTLLAQLVGQLDLPWAWCACDARMSSPVALLAHLRSAVERCVPGFGAELANRGAADALALAFCEEVDATVADDLVLVLDDVHNLGDEDVRRVVTILEKELPPQVRLVVASRVSPPIPMPRLLAAGAVELSERDLALSRDELPGFLSAAGVDDLDPARLEALHEAVEGWPAGVLIGARSRLGGLNARAGRGQVFDYLAAEVLADQPSDLVRFLEDLAPLSRFSPELAARVARREEAPALLAQLLERHLFVVRLDDEDEWYRCHGLMRAHLLERLTGDRERLIAAHRAAAAAWLGEGDVVEAAAHLLEAGDGEAALDVLDPVAEGLAVGPDATTFEALLSRVPAAEVERRPGIVLGQAAMEYRRGGYEVGFASAERAIEGLLATGEPERASGALVHLLMNMLVSGAPPARRAEVGARFIDAIPENPLLPLARLWHVPGVAFQGDFTAATEQIELARRHAAESPLPLGPYLKVMQGFYLDAPRGRPQRGLELLREAADELARAGPERDRFGMRIIALAYMPYLLNSLGRYEESLRAVDEVRAVAREYRFEGGERAITWWVLTALAWLGRWDELSAEMVPPARPLRGEEQTHYGYRYRAPAALYAAHSGDVAAVRAHIETALSEMEAHGRAFDRPWLLCDLSTAALRAGLEQTAQELADEARQIAVEIGMPWDHARAAVRAALTRHGPEADALIAEALDLTDRWAFHGLWTQRERADAAPLLARAMERHLGAPGLAARLVRLCGGEVADLVLERLADAPADVRAQLGPLLATAGARSADVSERLLNDRVAGVRAAAGRASEATPGTVRIRGFGTLVLERDGVALGRDAFGRQKARSLLAALLARRAGVHREQLLEWLWPDLPADRGLRAFHVTLHALRRALEPDLARGAASRMVVTEGESYRVVLEAGDSFDGWEMLDLVRGGRTTGDRMEDLSRAVRLHSGPLFAEWLYEEWSVDLRDATDAALAAALLELGTRLTNMGRAREAVPHLRALVDREPQSEQAHRALMHALMGAGERSLALRQYHACRSAIRRDQGVEPSGDTRALYEHILRDDDVPVPVSAR